MLIGFMRKVQKCSAKGGAKKPYLVQLRSVGVKVTLSFKGAFLVLRFHLVSLFFCHISSSLGVPQCFVIYEQLMRVSLGD